MFSGLDGFGAAGGDRTGHWGKQGPEILERCLATSLSSSAPAPVAMRWSRFQGSGCAIVVAAT